MVVHTNTESPYPVVSIRMTREQRDALDRAASAAGLSRGALIRRGFLHVIADDLMDTSK